MNKILQVADKKIKENQKEYSNTKQKLLIAFDLEQLHLKIVEIICQTEFAKRNIKNKNYNKNINYVKSEEKSLIYHSQKC